MLQVSVDRRVEKIVQMSAKELKETLPSDLNEIRNYGIEKALGEVPDLLSKIMVKLVEIDAAKFISELPEVSNKFMGLLWEGVGVLAIQSEELNSVLRKTKDMNINLEASDSPLRGHFKISQGKISGGPDLMHFKEQDIRLLGETRELLKLLRGEVSWGLGNLNLKTEGMPGLLPFLAPVIRCISRVIKGK